MRKYYRALLLLHVFASAAYGQKEADTLSFEDGTEVRYRMISKSANEYPKWNLNGGLLIAYNAKHLILGGSVAGNIQFDKLRLNAEADYGFLIGFSDDDLPAVGIRSFQKNFQHYKGHLGYPFFETTFDRETGIIMEEKYSSGHGGGLNSTSYMVYEDVKYNASLNLVVGYDYLLRPVAGENGGLSSNDASAPVQYQAMNVTSHNLRVGVAYNEWTYSVIEVNDNDMSKYIFSEVYAVALLPLSRSTNVVSIENLPAPETIRMETADSGFQEPDYNSVGFLIGLSAINDRGGSDVKRIRFAFEGGVLPGLKDQNLYFGLKIGLGFGERLFTKAPERKDPAFPE